MHPRLTLWTIGSFLKNEGLAPMDATQDRALRGLEHESFD